MNTKRTSFILSTLISGWFLISCDQKNKDSQSVPLMHPELPKDHDKEPKSRGVGLIKNLHLPDTLNPDLVAQGKFRFEMTCSNCHQLSDQRLVGPGWEDITNYRRPEWIMNMITNTEDMLALDEDAKAQLEDCLVKMPSQHVSVSEARAVLEFMRQNDLDRLNHKDEAATDTEF